MHTFRAPTSSGILGRKSTITSEFVRALIPVIEPTSEELEQALSILGQSIEALECSYCGGTYSEWDHLRPVVKNRKPTGYVSNIENLVPSCGKCNQSKGNKYWRDWMFSAAALSPLTRGVGDLDSRAERLQEYESWGGDAKVDFEGILPSEDLEQHRANLEAIVALMRSSHLHAEKLKSEIRSGANH